jgi:hypothetical protein
MRNTLGRMRGSRLMKARGLLVGAAIALVVLAASSAGLRWRYGVWSPLQAPAVIEYNQWRYATAWDADFGQTSRALVARGEPVPRPADLVPSDSANLPSWWRVFVAPGELKESYPETVFVRTLDGTMHPYGYKGMPPAD